MKTVRLFSATFLFLLVLSCTKVISVNLNSTNPNIVIEGNVNDSAGPYYIQITRTVDFSEPNIFPPVNGATVKITDGTIGVTDSLIELSPGFYSTQTLLQGVPGHTYILSVSAEGKTYTASSTMPMPVIFDSLTFFSSTIFGTSRTNAVVNFQDPPDTANYYTFTEFVNDKQIDRTFDFSDRLSDGKYIRYQLYNDSTYINPGDEVRVEMHCVDVNVWNYFNTLGQARGNNSQAVTPANPVSNLSNNALGYFSAQTNQTRTAFLK